MSDPNLSDHIPKGPPPMTDWATAWGTGDGVAGAGASNPAASWAPAQDNYAGVSVAPARLDPGSP